MAPTRPTLPEELVVWEILVRLPEKTLLRCRSWCRLTSAADFLLAHHRCQPSLPLVTFFVSDRDFAAVDALDLYLGAFMVYASCDGLLSCSPATQATPSTSATRPRASGPCFPSSSTVA
jgi:hypothetical protein